MAPVETRVGGGRARPSLPRTRPRRRDSRGPRLRPAAQREIRPAPGRVTVALAPSGSAIRQPGAGRPTRVLVLSRPYPPDRLPGAKVLGGQRGRPRAFRPESLVNISGMSFGSLSGPAVEALTRGAVLAACTILAKGE